MAKYIKLHVSTNERLIESHSCGDDYIALADCLVINRNTAYKIVLSNGSQEKMHSEMCVHKFF